MADSVSPQERLNLIQTLGDLPPSSLEALVFALRVPKSVMAGPAAAQGTKASSLLDWAEGPTGCGLRRVRDLLEQLMNPLIEESDDDISLDRDLALDMVDLAYFNPKFSYLLCEASRVINRRNDLDESTGSSNLFISLMKDGFRFIRSANSQLQTLEFAAKQLIAETQFRIDRKIQELNAAEDIDVETIKHYEEVSIDLLRLMDELSIGFESSQWILERLDKLSEDASNNATKIKNRLSREAISDFTYNVKVYLKVMSHCLEWDDIHSLDKEMIYGVRKILYRPDEIAGMNKEEYTQNLERAFIYIRTRVSSSNLSQKCKDKIYQCTDYLIRQNKYL